jgi:hypothetical protein
MKASTTGAFLTSARQDGVAAFSASRNTRDGCGGWPRLRGDSPFEDCGPCRRAAQEDRKRVQASASGGQDALGGEVPLAAAVDEVDVHHFVAIRECPYFLRIGQLGTGGGVEEIDRAIADLRAMRGWRGSCV